MATTPVGGIPSNSHQSYLNALYTNEPEQPCTHQDSVEPTESKAPKASEVQHDQVSSAKHTFAENVELLNDYYGGQGYTGSQSHLFYVETDNLYGSCTIMCDYGAQLARECGARNVRGLSWVSEDDVLSNGRTAGEYIAQLAQDV